MTSLAPEFINGTFVWRVVVPDDPRGLERTAEAITAVQNLLDRTVRSCVITNGFIGLDDVFPNWDGTWPYWSRATYRADHSWSKISDFMVAMRDEHNAWISFHTNLTDVNVGLREHPEMADFFDRLQAADAIYTRDGYGCGIPFKGPAYVPRTIPTDTAKMDYVEPGDAADIFAIVNYEKFWQSGLAQELIDGFYDHLPYPPLMLYCDVLTTTGSNLTAGLPDGLLGGSEQTQVAGRESILEYIRSKGSEPGGESPSWWTRYNWNHGGMSLNDYSRIETGYAQGARAYRGAEWQHVYGNQGAYSLDIEGALRAKDMAFAPAVGGGVVSTGGESAASSETAEWRTTEQVIEGFYLTAIQELFHIGCGNTRLPGGANIARLDEHRGRLLPDRVDVHGRTGQWLSGAQFSDGEIVAPCIAIPHPQATNGLVIDSLGESLAGSCSVTVDVDVAGPGHIVVRYSSVDGGTAEVELNGVTLGEIEFPATATPAIFGDLAIPVELVAGTNVVTLSKGSIHTAWSDGTQARWDRDGFRAWNDDVEYGRGYDRMWPDSWSGEEKIYFYSRDGMNRAWRLPAQWRDRSTVRLITLGATGRQAEITLGIVDGAVTVPLGAGVPGVLLP